ncbi:hypothetical protein [Alkaliphilus crotonatoxidans]
MEDILIKSVKSHLSEKKADSITIDYDNVCNCCSSYKTPRAKLGKPEYDNNFNTYVYEDILFYVNKQLLFNKELVTSQLSSLLDEV